MLTRWGETLDKQQVLQEYPRPQLVRESFYNLNGLWDYAITASDACPGAWDGQILVPFSPEAPLSGVGKTLRPGQVLWYRRPLPLKKRAGMRTLLHFGAVDQRAWVYVNGLLAGTHTGGYTAFTLDITKLLREGENTLTVAVRDDTDTVPLARGKQKTKRGGIWYTPQSGIWQTVWAELVPERYIGSLLFTPELPEGRIRWQVFSAAPQGAKVSVCYQGEPVAEGETDADGCGSAVIAPEQLHLWTPETPELYDVTVTLGDDTVKSYFAMRTVGTGRDAAGHPCLLLNGQPYFHHGVLDQGYWPDGLYTAPSDEALIYDIRAMKDLGFNMLRKHGKIEADRWYFHCDRMGMLVWQDMPNGGSSYHHWFVTYLATLLNWMRIPVKDIHAKLLSRTDEDGRQEYVDDIRGMIRALYNHPSIVTWIPFNEGWGQFSTKQVTDMIHKLDSSRLVDSASGWFDQGCGDINSLHYYFLGLPIPRSKRVLALSEFGGYSLRVPEHSACKNTYGYKKFTTSDGLTSGFAHLMEETIVPSVKKGYSAAIYTQLSDIEEEVNGLITYDRKKVKMNPLIVQKWNARIKKALK